MTRIRKAVFPVAGLGTRFLLGTKAMSAAIADFLQDHPVLAYEFIGSRYDRGKLGYLKAVLLYVLKHPAISESAQLRPAVKKERHVHMSFLERTLLAFSPTPWEIIKYRLVASVLLEHIAEPAWPGTT